MNFTLAFIGIGIVVILGFCWGAASIIAGYEEDENKNLIPDSWEFWNKNNKKK